MLIHNLFFYGLYVYYYIWARYFKIQRTNVLGHSALLSLEDRMRGYRIKERK